MTEITVELPDDLAESVQFWASTAARPINDIVRELLESGMRWNVSARPKILPTLDGGLIDTDALQARVTAFLEKEIDAFLETHTTEVFCSLALDTNLEYGQVLISANTNELLDKCLARYQHSSYGAREHYLSEEGVRGLRRNVGDWGYAAFAELTLLTDTEIDAIHHALPGDFHRSWEIVTDELMEVISMALIKFRATEVFRRMPKTRDFLSFCIDHDESYEDIGLRMIRASQQIR